MLIRSRLLVAGLLALAAGGVSAASNPRWSGELSLRATLEPEAEAAETQAAAVSCGSAAARYEMGSGAGVWVVRTGTVVADNPLRPLAPEEMIVLEVVADGRVATAFGTDYDALRQGGPPGRLEADMGAPIRWDGSVEPRNASFSTVAQDGSRLLGPFLFDHCAGPADVTSSASIDAPDGAGARRPPGPSRSARVRLPQGAIPENRSSRTPPTLPRR